MPSLSERKAYVYNGPRPDPQQRLERWIRKKVAPPAHIVKRPLEYRLPKKVQEAHSYPAPEVWLTESGELRLGDPIDGDVIGNINNK